MEENERVLDELTSYIRELECLRIRCTTIASLPPELLAEIFLQFVMDFWDTYSRTPKSLRNRFLPYRPWMTLKHVCQRWDGIVVHTPALFTTITPRPRDIVDFEVALSRSLPLDILYHRRFSKQALERVLTEIPRVRSMELELERSLLYSLDLDNLPTLDAPKLVTLDYEVFFGDSPGTHSIPFFSRLRAPRLTTLRLKAVGGSVQLLTTFIRPTLTTLDVVIRAHGDISALLDMLSTMPVLCTLSLHLIQSWGGFSSHVNLPQLSSLTLREDGVGYAILQILGCIDIPSLTTLKFWMRASAGCPSYVSHSFTETLKDKMRQPALSAAFCPRTIAVKECFFNDQSVYFAVAIWGSDRDLDIPEEHNDWEPGTEPEASCFSQRCQDTQHVVGELLPLFDRSSVSHMWIRADLSVEVNRELWRDHFQSTPNLTTLCVYGFGVEELLRASRDGSEPLALPALKTLILHDLQFNDEKDCSLLSALVSALHSRQVASGITEMLDKIVLCSPRPMTRLGGATAAIMASRRHSTLRAISRSQIEYLVAAKVAKVVEVDGIEESS